MAHMISADVLIKSDSGFSNVASVYSAGVKLAFVPHIDLFLQATNMLHLTCMHSLCDGDMMAPSSPIAHAH